MNETFFNHAMQVVKDITQDEVRMWAKTLGFEYINFTLLSRNKREGRYAGKALGYHYRYKGYSDMTPDAFMATGMLLRCFPRKAKVARRFLKSI